MQFELVSVSPRHSVNQSAIEPAQSDSAPPIVVLAVADAGEALLDVAIACEDVDDWTGHRLIGRGATDEICLSGDLSATGKGQASAAVRLKGDNLAAMAAALGTVAWSVVAPSGKTAACAGSPTFLAILPADLALLFPRGIPNAVLGDLFDAVRDENGTAQRLTTATIVDLAKQVFGQNPPRYDRDHGASSYITRNNGWDDITFHQKRYDDARANTKALINCHDCAAYLQVLLRVAKYAVRYCYIAPFGYLRKTPLIGRGLCNNPFVTYDSALVLPDTSINRTAFGNHGFCEVTVGTKKTIADACAGPHIGTEDRAAYVDAATDDKMPVPPFTNRGTVEDITDYYGVTKIDSLVSLWLSGMQTMESTTSRPVIATARSKQAEAFAAAIGHTAGGDAFEDAPVAILDPARELAEAGFALAFTDTAIGYPECNRYYRFEQGEVNLTLTIHVSSIGPARAHERFLDLGADYQSVEPPYVSGPPGLGAASAMLTGADSSRLFWIEGNTVFDLRADAPIDLVPLAERLHGAVISVAEAEPPSVGLAAPDDAHAGEELLVAVDTPQGSLVDFALGEPGLAFAGEGAGELRFKALASGLVRLAVTAADPQTLLASQQIITIEIAPRH